LANAVVVRFLINGNKYREMMSCVQVKSYDNAMV